MEMGALQTGVEVIAILAAMSCLLWLAVRQSGRLVRIERDRLLQQDPRIYKKLKHDRDSAGIRTVVSSILLDQVRFALPNPVENSQGDIGLDPRTCALFTDQVWRPLASGCVAAIEDEITAGRNLHTHIGLGTGSSPDLVAVYRSTHDLAAYIADTARRERELTHELIDVAQRLDVSHAELAPLEAQQAELQQAIQRKRTTGGKNWDKKVGGLQERLRSVQTKITQAKSAARGLRGKQKELETARKQLRDQRECVHPVLMVRLVRAARDAGLTDLAGALESEERANMIGDLPNSVRQFLDAEYDRQTCIPIEFFLESPPPSRRMGRRAKFAVSAIVVVACGLLTFAKLTSTTTAPDDHEQASHWQRSELSRLYQISPATSERLTFARIIPREQGSHTTKVGPDKNATVVLGQAKLNVPGGDEGRTLRLRYEDAKGDKAWHWLKWYENVEHGWTEMIVPDHLRPGTYRLALETVEPAGTLRVNYFTMLIHRNTQDGELYCRVNAEQSRGQVGRQGSAPAGVPQQIYTMAFTKPEGAFTYRVRRGQDLTLRLGAMKSTYPPDRTGLIVRIGYRPVASSEPWQPLRWHEHDESRTVEPVLPKDIAAGTYELLLILADGAGNHVEAYFEILVRRHADGNPYYLCQPASARANPVIKFGGTKYTAVVTEALGKQAHDTPITAPFMIRLGGIYVRIPRSAAGVTARLSYQKGAGAWRPLAWCHYAPWRMVEPILPRTMSPGSYLLRLDMHGGDLATRIEKGTSVRV